MQFRHVVEGLFARASLHRSACDVVGDHFSACKSQYLGAGDRIVTGQAHFDETTARARRRIDRNRSLVCELGCEGLDRSVDQAVGDLACLVIADEHGIDDLVDRARAARVVCGVSNQLDPGAGQEG